MNIVDSQASDLATVTTSDTVPCSFISIYVGGTGNLTVVTEAEFYRKTRANPTGTAAAILAACTGVLITACPVGFVLNARIRGVRATGTTATALVGFMP